MLDCPSDPVSELSMMTVLEFIKPAKTNYAMRLKPTKVEPPQLPEEPKILKLIKANLFRMLVTVLGAT